MENFAIDEPVILNEKVQKGLPSQVGSLVHIARFRRNNSAYDYDVKLPSGDYAFVRESELNKLTDEQKELITYVRQGYHVEYTPTNEVVLILKTDFLHNVVEVEFEDAGILVVDMNTLKKIEKKVDSVEDSNTYTYEDLLEVFFGHYKNSDETYTVPKEFLINILKQFTE